MSGTTYGGESTDGLNIGGDRQQRDQKIGLWLLIGQFLTVASILLIVSVSDFRTPSGLSLKILGIGASLIGVGIVFIFRRFRLQSASCRLTTPSQRDLPGPVEPEKSSEVVFRPTVPAAKVAAAFQPGQGRNRRTDFRSRVNHPNPAHQPGRGSRGREGS